MCTTKKKKSKPLFFRRSNAGKRYDTKPSSPVTTTTVTGASEDAEMRHSSDSSIGTISTWDESLASFRTTWDVSLASFLRKPVTTNVSLNASHCGSIVATNSSIPLPLKLFTTQKRHEENFVFQNIPQQSSVPLQEQLEKDERSMGPIDLDTLCEEFVAPNENNPNDPVIMIPGPVDVDALLEPMESSFDSMLQQQEQEQQHLLMTTTEDTVSIKENCDTEQISSLKGDGVGDQETVNSYGPVDVDDLIPDELIETNDYVYEYILDEVDICRRLEGYEEGFEPEVVTDISEETILQWNKDIAAEEEEEYERDKNRSRIYHRSQCTTGSSHCEDYSLPLSAAEV